LVTLVAASWWAAGEEPVSNPWVQSGIVVFLLGVVIAFAKVQDERIKAGHAAQVTSLEAANKAQTDILQGIITREQARADKLEEIVREQTGKMAEMNNSLHDALRVAGEMMDLIKGK
jgi:hypothetical protein